MVRARIFTSWRMTEPHGSLKSMIPFPRIIPVVNTSCDHHRWAAVPVVNITRKRIVISSVDFLSGHQVGTYLRTYFSRLAIQRCSTNGGIPASWTTFPFELWDVEESANMVDWTGPGVEQKCHSQCQWLHHSLGGSRNTNYDGTGNTMTFIVVDDFWWRRPTIKK